MQIVLHAGVHNTDEDRLLKCLLKNRDKLREDGVCVPGPSRYRRLLRDTLQAMERAAPPAPGPRRAAGYDDRHRLSRAPGAIE